jgi:hypothetical protein
MKLYINGGLLWIIFDLYIFFFKEENNLYVSLLFQGNSHLTSRSNRIIYNTVLSAPSVYIPLGYAVYPFMGSAGQCVGATGYNVSLRRT